MGRNPHLQPWQFRQTSDAIQILHGIVNTEWTAPPDWDFWRDSARTLKAQHETTAREFARVPPEDYAGWIGDMHFSPLMRMHLDDFVRLASGIRSRRMSIRTVQEPRGQSNVSTTRICTHVLNRGGFAVRGSLDTG